MKHGYYWIKFKDEKEETIGYYGGDNIDSIIGEYNKERYKDGSGDDGEVFTWRLVGSDEIFKNSEIEVIREAK